MRGTNAYTGRELDGINHLRQSITDIFNTRVGTRVMRRDYGSDLPNLIDNPYDGHLHPLPSTLVTTVIRIADGSVRATYDGFALSWCTMAP